jgi:hypothetical protein
MTAKAGLHSAALFAGGRGAGKERRRINPCNQKLLWLWQSQPSIDL